MIQVLCQILLLARLPVVQHQPEAVALVSRTLLGAVGDVAAIGRIERRRVAGGIVGGDVLGLRQNLRGRGARRSIDRDNPQIVVGRSRRILVVIRGVANLLPVGREGIVILPAERKNRRIIVAGCEVAYSERLTGKLPTPFRNRRLRYWHPPDTTDMTPLSLLCTRSNADRADDRRFAP